MSTDVSPSFFLDLGTEIVTIHVGPKEHPYTIHKNILCKKISYFESKFPASTQATKLPDADPEAFDILVKWLYGGDIEIKKPKSHKEHGEVTVAAYSNTLKLYGLAEKLSSVKLMDDTMTAMFPIVRFIGIPDFDDIKLSYAITSPGSKLRDFMAGSFAWRLVFAAKNKERAEKSQKNLDEIQKSRNTQRVIHEEARISLDELIAWQLAEENADEGQLEEGSAGEQTTEEGKPGETATEEGKEPSRNIEDLNSEDAESQEESDNDESDAPPGFYSKLKEKWVKYEEQWTMEEKLGLMKVGPEWLVPSEDFWTLTTEVDGLGKDAFGWLYHFAHTPRAPADHSVCYFHKHPSYSCGDGEKFPEMKESLLYPKITMDYENCKVSLPALPSLKADADDV